MFEMMRGKHRVPLGPVIYGEWFEIYFSKREVHSNGHQDYRNRAYRR